jgi:predicted metal-dependent peptidase
MTTSTLNLSLVPSTSNAENTVEFDLDLHMYRLLVSEPFFASISRQINKSASNALPTAGVRINKDTMQYELLYNPKFMASLTDNEKIGVLMHEFYHLIFDHVGMRLPEGGMTKMWNIAADLAINGLPGVIERIPKIACIPGVGTFKDYPAEQSADYYFERLKNDPEQNKSKDDKGEGEPQDGEGEGQPSDASGNPSNGNGSFDDHTGWGDVPDDVKAVAEERLKEIIKDAAGEASKSHNWGTVSSECRKQIMERLKSYVDWRKMLRYFIKATIRADKHSTIRRINKRYPRIHAGSKVTRLANIAISIDQSGSVDDNLLAAFFTELNELASLATFTVVPFDTEVNEKLVYVWKKGQRKVWERVMCGGTDFNAPTKWVNENDFDGHIVLTDMCAPKPIASKCKRMWMTDKANFDSPYFKTNEIVVAITPSGK